MIWLKSLNNRTKEDVYPERNAFSKAWCVFGPVIAYYLVDTLIVKLCAILIKNVALSNSAFAIFCEEKSSLVSVMVKLLAMICGTCILIPMLYKEKLVIYRKKEQAENYILVAILGVAAALFFNLLFSMVGFTEKSESYSQVAQKQFSLPLLIGILMYGIVTPIVEELIFRGLVYNRLARNYNIILAIGGSAALFGFYHGNIVQAIYGIIMGLLLAIVYEKYGSFVYPVILHGVANTWIYLCMSVDFLKKYILNIASLVIAGIIMIISFGIMWRAKND